MDDATTPLYVGPSGWSYSDWQGVVYPRRRDVDQLTFISQYFNAVEINSSFYRVPTAKMTASWVRRARQPFRFVVKAHQRFTHQRDTLPTAKEGAEFAECLKPVAQAGMLGCVLLQFPWSFRCNEESFHWLFRIREHLEAFPLAVEVRHGSWDAPAPRYRLRAMDLNLCNIDQPALHDCLAPADHTTGPIGYIRLHGRRTDTWFADNIEPHERYNYLYSPAELAEWAIRIAAVRDHADEVYVFANNHFRGQGPANALQLTALLTGEKVDVPPDLLASFGDLAEIATHADPPPGQQMRLFE